MFKFAPQDRQRGPPDRYGGFYDQYGRENSSARFTNNHNVEFETLSSHSNTNSKLLGKRSFQFPPTRQNVAPSLPSVKSLSQLHDSPLRGNEQQPPSLGHRDSMFGL